MIWWLKYVFIGVMLFLLSGCSMFFIIMVYFVFYYWKIIFDLVFEAW